MRDDIKFSDGVKVTSEDVKFTFDTTVKNKSVVDLTNLESVDVIDNKTISFNLKESESTFVNNLIVTGIVPKHAYNKGYAEHPVGSGPYKLVQWDKGQQMIIEANEQYYDTKPNLKRITFLFLNEDAAFAAAKSGSVDLAYIPAAFSEETVKGMTLKTFDTVDNRGIAFPYIKAGEKTSEGIAIGNDVTADLAIRQAINIAVDRQALIDGVLNGYGTPAYTSVDGLPWWNKETVIDDGNMKQAKDILAKAGWKDTDDDGILEKDGMKAEFELYYLSDDEVRQSLSIAVSDMLKPLGINIKVEAGNWDTIGKKMHSEAVMMGWGSHDPHELYNLYDSKNAGDGYFNTGYYKNEHVDAYFEQALLSKTQDEAYDFFKQAQWDGATGLSAKGDAPWAWLVNIKHLYFVKNGLDVGKQRIHVHGNGWPIIDNIEEWKWSQ
ncbi:MAG: ABC transporter substrate-binding protein [Vagococcus sp.]